MLKVYSLGNLKLYTRPTFEIIGFFSHHFLCVLKIKNSKDVLTLDMDTSVQQYKTMLVIGTVELLEISETVKSTCH